MDLPELYLLPIEQVDTHARLMRQCEAMVAQIAGRGIALPAEVLEHLALLDIPIEDRHKIPLRDLITLHGALADAIRPALPQTVELLQWDLRRKDVRFGHFAAPVSAIRKVILCTIICFLVFFGVVIWGGLTSDDVKNGFSVFADTVPEKKTGAGTAFLLVLFFTSLSAIGACFSALYDANRFVTEGSYDPRYGSSYAIRIGLGMISGFLLSQLLPTVNSDLALFTRAMLALLGGFAGQLVYNVLNRLVRAVDSLFDEDTRTLVTRMQGEAAAREQAAANRQKAAQASEAAAFATQMEAATDPAARAELARAFVAKTTGAAAGTASSPAAAAGDPAAVLIAKAESSAAFLRSLIEILPDGEGAPVREALVKLEAAIARAQTLDRSDLLSEAVRLGATELVERPLRKVLVKTLGTLAGPLATLGLTPVGVATVVVTLAVQKGSDAYLRWKVRVLDAPYQPDLLPGDPIDTAAVKTALDAEPAALKALAPAIDDMDALNELGHAAADLGADAFFDLHGRGFGGSRADFDAAVAPFRDRMAGLRKAGLDSVVAAEIPAVPLAEAGIADAGKLFAALDLLQTTPEARAELEKLMLIAAATRDPQTGAGMLDTILAALAAAEQERTAV